MGKKKAEAGFVLETNLHLRNLSTRASTPKKDEVLKKDRCASTLVHMLPKENRLKKKLEFRQVLEKGKMFQSGLFGAAVLKTADMTPPRVGIVISTKLSKLATKRNRTKRLLREAIKNEIGGLEPGTRLVFLAKKAILEAGQGAVLKEVENLVKKIKTK